MIERHGGRRLAAGRRLPLVVIAIYGIALVAWIAILRRWVPMPGGEMETPMRMSDPGVPEAMATGHGLVGVALYLAMWGVMMIAMMYPSSVPLFRLYYGTLRETPRATKLVRLGALLGTYTLVWTLTGLIPLAINAVVPIAPLAADHGPLLFGGVLVLLGGYQLSPYKYRCLDRCRSPLGFLMVYYRPGIRGAASMGFRFSYFCVGCCWALFAFMVVAGSMNVLWMAVIAVVLSLERTVPWGPRLAVAVGVVAGAAGTALILATLL
jgi:predicted metal-binding membrane protein